MARRYFDAETTEAEERMLKRFAASPEADGAEWDELRAVMGYATIGKRIRGQVAATNTIPLRRMPQWMQIAAAAVFAGLIILPITMWLTDSQDSLDEDICIAYVNGNRVTDPAQVIQAMHHAMSHVQQVEPMTTVEEQLGSMFELMKE